MSEPRRILVITSCTGEKVVSHERQLTRDDFAKGPKRIEARHRELESLLTPAEQLYTGLQHVRLMHGVRVIREARPDNVVDLWIVSAGYGLVPGDRKLAPYEATFSGMGKAELDEWADHLGLPNDVGQLLSKPFDLALILLGNDYLRACRFTDETHLGGPTIFLASAASAKKLPRLQGARAAVLSTGDAKRFSCGLVGLKGEIGARLLERVARDPAVAGALADPATDILDLLTQEAPQKAKREKARPNPKVDRVITLPAEWHQKPHRSRLRYFIPEWDDLVDPDYDFEQDAHWGGRGDWSNEVYAHQMYPEPNYDGILMSRAVAEKSKSKNSRITALGVHRYLRVPREFPIMGDCGAFDYIEADDPPYSTQDVIEYYSRLDFDYGVSVDHLVVPAFEQQKYRRYELTVHNAEEFLKEHRKLGLPWEPIGAVQGWDIKRYVEAARKCIAMGYRYIALGGLVRSQTSEILATVQAVREVIPTEVQMHVFGFSRFDAIQDLIHAGANSIDSASMLRKAWLGANLNYLTPAGWYPAIRIPQAGGSFRAKRLVEDGKASLEQLQRLERECLRELRAFASGHCSPSEVLISHLVEYDTLVAGERAGTAQRLRRTLEDRPWEHCDCAICRRWGVEVVIFRGNNRNRRRGFHNTYVFYGLMQDMANGTRRMLDVGPNSQIELAIEKVALGA